MNGIKYLVLIFSLSFATLIASPDNNIFINKIISIISVPEVYPGNFSSGELLYDTIKVKSHTRIGNEPAIFNFYNKLELLKKGLIDSVVIFHIGDSHIKGKFFTNSIKEKFDNDFEKVIYQTLGMDGASFKSFGKKTDYLDLIEESNPDLVIISLGTNDASGDTVIAKDFLKSVSRVTDLIRKINPEIEILMTTPPDYIKKGEINRNIPYLNEYLFEFCYDNNIAYWDLYEAMGGEGSALKWIEQELMAKDKIHYKKEGYEKQAEMFYRDLMFTE